MTLSPIFTAPLDRLRQALDTRSPLAAHLAFRLLELHSPQLALHSIRVASLTQEIAVLASYSGDPVPLRLGGLLHDLGKIAMPAELFDAARPLFDAERADIQRHPIAGVGLLVSESVPSFALIDAIAHHHERYDGTGYPCGLAGIRIPLSARIVALADVVEVLLRPRPYQTLSPREARAELLEAAGTQLDPDLTALALRYLLPAEQ